MYSLLDQVPRDQALFYEAHRARDDHSKSVMHGKYAMETSLALRTHIVKELSELEELLQTIDATTQLESGGDHPRLPMIRRYNQFLFQTLEMVKHRIDVRAQGGLAKRKRE